MTSDLTTCTLTKKIRYHDVLKRTASLLGNDVCSKDWISESRSNYSQLGHITLPRQRPTLFVTQLDGSRRHNPQPRLASLFRARHGQLLRSLFQHDVCTVKTLLPEVLEVSTTEKSAYTIEFQKHPVRPATTLKSDRVHNMPHGILPSCRIPLYDDVRTEILLPVQISEKSPSTQNPYKYMPRRRRISESQNQHRTNDTPYGTDDLQSTPSSGQYHQSHFITANGRALLQRRHVSAPADSLTVRGFDGGAVKLREDTMQAQLLPFLRGPRII